jgi:CRP-like cAMP-binding protein
MGLYHPPGRAGHMKAKRNPKSFYLKAFLTKSNGGRTNLEYRAHDRIFVQGETANAVFYIKPGKVKLTVLFRQGDSSLLNAVLHN